MAHTGVTLTYDTELYTFVEDDDTVLKGRLSCDCVKSQLIRTYCDPEFPLLRCGARIGVVSLTDISCKVSRDAGQQQSSAGYGRR